MKLQISLFFCCLGFALCGFAKMNDVFFLRGKIKSFNHKTVVVEVHGLTLMKIPREGIVEGFKLQSDTSVVTIPIYIKYFAKIQTQTEVHSQLEKAITSPTNTVSEVQRLIAAEQTRQKTLKHENN